jgi:D-amino-acid dehydrogenase
MRVAVLGAGVVGTATAYYLASAGDDVILIDEADSAGSGATSGNAGLLTAGDSTVWASPATLRTIPRVLTGRSPSIRLDRGAGFALLGWGARFIRECSPGRNRRNVFAAHTLSTFSLAATRALTDTFEVDLGLQSNGLLTLFETRAALDRGVAARALLVDAGVVLEILDQDQLIDLDSAFGAAPLPPQWGIYSPNDMSGNSLHFTQQLVARCQDLGVETLFNTTIMGFTRDQTGAVGVATSQGSVTADRYVVCLGHKSPALARSAGDRLTMMPATGFSITAPILDDDAVPQVPVIDEARHVAFSRMGDSLRVTSSAIIGSATAAVADRELKDIHAAVDCFFSSALDMTNAKARARARPVMARNRPAIGRGRDERVFYNAGHGALGWTQACGSAQLITSIIHHTVPPIDPSHYAI